MNQLKKNSAATTDIEMISVARRARVALDSIASALAAVDQGRAVALS